MAYWGDNPLWQNLTGPQRAAAMALLEAEVGRDGINVGNARNALGAMINRSIAEGQPIGEHVSRSIYQPIIEDNQYSRLNDVLQMPEFRELTNLAQQRLIGAVPDWVQGADHYLAPPQTMLALEAREPEKYKSWRNWTQFNPETGQYGNVVLQDDSHHFLKLYGDRPAAAPIMASAPRERGSAPSTERPDAVIPFLASLGIGSAAMPGILGDILAGMGGSAAPGAAAGGTAAGSSPLVAGGSPVGNPTASMDANGGMLSDLLGKFGGQSSDDPAVAAQQQAAGGGQRLQPLVRRPIDMTKLQAMIQARPMLGFRGMTT